jgi:hypothetical protein
MYRERYPPELFHYHLNSVTGHSISALSAQMKGYDLIQVSAYLTGPITSPEDCAKKFSYNKEVKI